MEIWKAYTGFETRYEISNYGNVRTVPEADKWGHRKERKSLRQVKTKKGYMRVTLFDGKKYHARLVHRMVAEMFVPNPNNKPVINHLDCDPTNNHAENLQWVTTQENNAYISMLGHRHYVPENILKAQESHKTKVVITNIKTGEKKVFNSMKECAAYTGTQERRIGKLCRKAYGYKTQRGYIYDFYEE